MVSGRTILLTIAAILVVAIAVGGYTIHTYLAQQPERAPMPLPSTHTPEPVEPEPAYYTSRVIGTSVEGRPIEAHRFGNGDEHLLFVGGIHGGYEWNSVILAYEFIDYFREAAGRVPEELSVSIVPNLNPDGTFAVIGKDGRFSLADVPEDEGPLGTGRMNANGVDLNRNFACKWQPESTWRGNVVSAGTEAFSEPEAAALRNLVFEIEPSAVAFWHSQSNAVYASECEAGVLPGTVALMETYADAAGYPSVLTFDAYPITGDAEGWLASIGIPAITVELSTHETVEWEKNRAGVEAVLAAYSAQPLAR